MQQNQRMSIAVRSSSGVWGSRTTFVLALTASAIGLGNLWRFSYLLGEQGGAPFLIAYLLCLFFVAVPVLVAEVLIGSHGRSNPVSALLYTSARSDITRAWLVIAWIASIASAIILAYYSVVAGWGLAYIGKMQSGVFSDASAAEVGRVFTTMLADPQQLLQSQTVFIVLTFTISALGIFRGLAVLFWFSIPLFLVALGVLVEYSLLNGDVTQAGEFLFSVNTYDFTAESVLLAMGQAFYTLSIGVGIGMAFGAYAPDKIPLGRTVLAVALFDTMVALAAGLVIFPIIFAANVEPAMGPGLMFVGLPYAFGNMVEGELFGAIFFITITVVALSSAVALAEPVMSYLVERMRLRRPVAALLFGTVTWFVALGCALSFNEWQDVYWYQQMTLFQLLERVSTVILLPTAALLTALLVGYCIRREILRVELYRESRLFIFLWRFCLRYIAPPAIVIVMASALLEKF